MTFRGNLLLYSLWYELHPFENLRRKGHHCHGLTHLSRAERKIFYRVLGKKFCGLFIYPGQSVRQVVAVSAPGDRDSYGCVAPAGNGAGTRRNDGERVRETAVAPYIPAAFFGRDAGSAGHGATRVGATGNGRCKPGVFTHRTVATARNRASGFGRRTGGCASSCLSESGLTTGCRQAAGSRRCARQTEQHCSSQNQSSR